MTCKVSSWLMGTQLTHKRLSFKNIYRWANPYTDGVCYSVKECQWWKGLGVCRLFYRWGGWGQKGHQHRNCTTRASLFPFLMLSSLQCYYPLNPPICRCVCVYMCLCKWTHTLFDCLPPLSSSRTTIFVFITRCSNLFCYRNILPHT